MQETQLNIKQCMNQFLQILKTNARNTAQYYTMYELVFTDIENKCKKHNSILITLYSIFSQMYTVVFTNIVSKYKKHDSILNNVYSYLLTNIERKFKEHDLILNTIQTSSLQILRVKETQLNIKNNVHYFPTDFESKCKKNNSISNNAIRLLDSLVVECWLRVREVPGSIPSQGPRHTKDVIKMVPVVPLFSTQH